MKTRNLSIPEISRATGLSDSTLRSIISRKTKNISLEVAFKLSQGLNVSLEELNGEKEISTNIDKAIELSIEEKNHLEDLRKLNDMGKKKVITYTKDLIEMPKYIKETESDYLAPIAAHDDNLTDEEKAVMDQKINEYLKKHK
ncbi:hypothetical protein NPD11_455 [Clostridium baratii]|nr:hypothetical protein NPD11_455 [Clostridium baratii]